MTRRILLSILMPCMAYCAVAKDGGGVVIALEESAGKLSANPGFIEMAPQSSLRLSILSPFQPGCTVHGMGGMVTVSANDAAFKCEKQDKEDDARTSVPFLEFSHGSQRARVLVIVQPASTFPPTVALVAALLTVGTALLALWQWRSAGDSQLERAIGRDASSDLREVREKLSAVSSALYPRAETRARRATVKTTQSWEHSTTAAVPAVSAGNNARLRIERFVAATRNWCQVAGMVPRDVETNLSHVQDLLSSGVVETSQFLEPATIVSRLILNFSDDRNDFHDNHQVEEALQHLLKTAELDLIYPQQGDSYNPDLHKMLGSQTAPGSQFRGRISRVTRRGLCNRQSLISKAEVYVYD